jgi:hypothetical protein
MTTSHISQSGEAGHQGNDRQAGKNLASSHKPTPDPAQAATPADVHARSRNAQTTHAARKQDDAPDRLHPGPDRAESEKSHGGTHHDQHEPQPNMFDDVEDL